MSAATKTWPAPAKLNLFLHITDRREDGYHLLQTVFQFLDFCDQLRFSPRDDERIVLERDCAGIPPQENLVVRAALLLQSRLEQRRGVSIHIDKRLPMGGGLGGGSSDAATTLVALNRLWQIGLSTDELAELGLTLGADVPIFVHGHAAWAEGVGEQISRIDLPEPWYTVICPGVHVPTAEIFSAPQLTRNCRAITIRDFLEGRATRNVCQAVVVERYPEVAKALDFLDTCHRSGPVRMTGTGSCVFAAFADRADAQQALEGLPAGWQGFVAKARNISPLYSESR